MSSMLLSNHLNMHKPSYHHFLIISLLLSILHINLTSSQVNFTYPNTIAVVCYNTTTNVSWVYSEDEITTLSPTFTSTVNIYPLYACYLYVRLSDSTDFVFDSESNCSFSVELQEPQSNDPTIDPTSDPTSDPTMEPTINPSSAPTVPTSDPTFNPTTPQPSGSPTKNPTMAPTTDPTSDPTIDPTKNPTYNPTITFSPTMEPTTDPTMDPLTSTTPGTTEESYLIDLDEVFMWNIFNDNTENLLWFNGLTNYSTNTSQTFYEFKISPGCNQGTTSNNDSFGSLDIKGTNYEWPNVVALFIAARESNTTRYDNKRYPISTTNPFDTLLFPTKFTINSYDTTEESSASFSISGDDDTPGIKCNYNDAFETIGDKDNNTVGIEYIMWPQQNFNSSIEEISDVRYGVSLDVIITRQCIADTTTNVETTAFPFDDMNITTSTELIVTTKDDGKLFGVELETFIAMVVTGGLLFTICLFCCLYQLRRKSVWEDQEEEEMDRILKGPAEHTELAKVHEPFTVKPEDHQEMLNRQHSLSMSAGLDKTAPNSGPPDIKTDRDMRSRGEH